MTRYRRTADTRSVILNRPPDVTGIDAGELVEASLHRDEGFGHQPVDLVPCCRDVGSDCIAEYFDDCGEEVFVHDCVLVRA